MFSSDINVDAEYRKTASPNNIKVRFTLDSIFFELIKITIKNKPSNVKIYVKSSISDIVFAFSITVRSLFYSAGNKIVLPKCISGRFLHS